MGERLSLVEAAIRIAERNFATGRAERETLVDEILRVQETLKAAASPLGEAPTQIFPPPSSSQTNEKPPKRTP